MPGPFAQATTQELLSALENAGRQPSLDLIRAAMNRRHDLTPGLLDMLATSPDKNWANDDPRVYAQIHAGNLLIFFREPQAIPIFMDLLRGPDNFTIIEWFETALASYGLGILPALSDLLTDPTASRDARVEATTTLEQLVAEFPTERAKVIQVLRNALPQLDKKGALEIPKPRPSKPAVVWTFIASTLATLGDYTSRRQVEALYHDQWLDESVIGTEADYLQTLLHPEPLRSDAFNIIELYSSLAEEEAPLPGWDRTSITKLQEQLHTLNAAQQSSQDTSVPAASADEEFPTEAVAPKRQARPAANLSTGAFVVPSIPQPVRREEPKVGRNDPCPCGSGRKYKHCHGKS